MDLILVFVGGLMSLAGTYLGFVLSERAAQAREQRENQETVRSVRTVIRIEINRNLERIDSFLDELSQREQQLPGDERGKRDALKGVSLIHSSGSIWETQIPFAARALTQEEIEAVLDFYTALSGLSYNLVDYQNRSTMTVSSRDLYEQIITTANDLKQKGNPIKVLPPAIPPAY